MSEIVCYFSPQKCSKQIAHYIETIGSKIVCYFFAVKMHRKIAHYFGTKIQKNGFATGKFPVGVELGGRLVALFWRAGR